LIENPYRRKIFLDVNDLKVASLNKRLRGVSEVNLDFSAQSPTHFVISPGKTIKIMGDFILPDFSEEKPEWVSVSIAEHGLPIGFQVVNVRVLH